MSTVVCIGSALRVVGGAPPVDDDDGFVTDDPGVVPGGEGGDLAGDGVELPAVAAADPQGPGDVVLEVRGLAPPGAGDRSDVLGPAPPRLQGQPADLGAADVDQVHPAVRELAGLAGGGEVLLLVGRFHDLLLGSVMTPRKLGR